MIAGHQSNIVVFDIETIPQERLSPPLSKELERKAKDLVARDSIAEDEAKLKLQGLHPAFGRILCIGALYKNMDLNGDWGATREIFYADSERQVLSDFWKRWADFNGRKTVFVSFNGVKFDIPFIIARTVALNLSPTSQSFLDAHRYGRFPHFDACLVLDNPFTLEAACETFGVSSPKTNDVRGSNVWQLYQAGKILEILSYCLRDVKATYEIFEKIQPFFPLSYQDSRKAERIQKVKGAITPIPSRSPKFRCVACRRHVYPEDFDFRSGSDDLFCVGCKIALENDDVDFDADLDAYLEDDHTYEEYLASNSGSHFVPFEESDHMTDDDIPF